MTQARRVVLALACLASMLLVLPALAQPPKEPPCSGERQPYMAPAPKNLPESLVPYRPLALLNLTTILSPPPAAGPQQLADKLAVMHAQGSASEDRMGRADEDHDDKIDHMFGSVLGLKFDPDRLKAADTFFGNVTKASEMAVNSAKKAFGRRRPFVTYRPDIREPPEHSETCSYPSGHATRVILCAIILVAMLPDVPTLRDNLSKEDQERANKIEKIKNALWDRAEYFRQSAVIRGAHYPLDIEAGRLAGTALASVLLAVQDLPGKANEDLHAEFMAAQTDVRAALGLGN